MRLQLWPKATWLVGWLRDISFHSLTTFWLIVWFTSMLSVDTTLTEIIYSRITAGIQATTAYKSKSTCKKRNPTPAMKSTATPPKANYRNPLALDGVCLTTSTLSCPVVNSPQWTPAYFKVYMLGVNYCILSVASAINSTGTAIEVNS